MTEFVEGFYGPGPSIEHITDVHSLLLQTQSHNQTSPCKVSWLKECIGLAKHLNFIQVFM